MGRGCVWEWVMVEWRRGGVKHADIEIKCTIWSGLGMDDWMASLLHNFIHHQKQCCITSTWIATISIIAELKEKPTTRNDIYWTIKKLNEGGLFKIIFYFLRGYSFETVVISYILFKVFILAYRLQRTPPARLFCELNRQQHLHCSLNSLNGFVSTPQRFVVHESGACSYFLRSNKTLRNYNLPLFRGRRAKFNVARIYRTTSVLARTICDWTTILLHQ